MSEVGSFDLSALRIERSAPPPPRRSRAPWFVLAVVLAGAAFAWSRAAGRPPEVAVAPVVAVGGSGAGALSALSANGYVVARTKASVSAKVAGRLEALDAAEGTTLKKGDVLARIESADATAQLEAARATVAQQEAHLDLARKRHARETALRGGNATTEAEIDQAAADVASLEAQLRYARAQVRIAEVSLENTRVRAPFDGTVLRKDAEVGEFVAPSAAGGGLSRTAIVTMADLTTLEVEADVNEAYIARITNGQPAEIVLDAYPDARFQARVRQVVPTADRQKGTVQVKVAILDRDPRILPEMAAKVSFLDEAEAGGPEVAPVAPRWTVPAAAVTRASDGPRVFVLDGDQVVVRPVRLGSERGESYEVTGGLSAGDRVIVAPPDGLADGAKVRVKTP